VSPLRLPLNYCGLLWKAHCIGFYLLFFAMCFFTKLEYAPVIGVVALSFVNIYRKKSTTLITCLVPRFPNSSLCYFKF
jgi:hypothetical protein